MVGRWVVNLSEAAQLDLNELYAWTAERFGLSQAESYRQIVLDTLSDLRGRPDILGTRSRSELQEGLRSIHTARRGRRARHLIVFAVQAEGQVLVLRILHDSMDIARHLPDEDA